MSEQHHDSPYADSSSAGTSPRHGKSSRHNAQSQPQRDRSAKPLRKTGRTKHPQQARAAHGPSKAHAAQVAPARKRRRRRGNGVYKQPDELTSHPITRNAYVETRVWLLHKHGPICAYCGVKHAAKVMTLDHVAPRRGQTAYDRRDNLVLACQTCNAAKRDMAPLAFLLGARQRARNLLRYGSHLSAGLIDLARSLISERELDEIDSPYKD